MALLCHDLVGVVWAVGVGLIHRRLLLSISPDPPKGGALALTQGLMGKGRRTIQARFQ